ncbi:MAG TPA: bile acid:sodium symporter [Methanocella sp.]|uniref:bile acid:sodium symporter family protein n=1 Tax=Methanocella sp. TaxID=2052833 RepID=UPI002D0B5099|nr:bile acid:sodium symporter [Methanocella sp.]HTY91309.1 bile acid:sodium symporter [Methanocella sp.]
MANTTLEIIQACAGVSVFAYVFSRGLGSRFVDLGYFGARPGLMLRSFLSVDVIVPLIAMAAVILVSPAKPTSIGLLLLASSPAAPLVLRAISKAGGKPEYAVSLQVMLASLAIVMTPVTLFLLSAVTGLTLGIDPLNVAESVGLSVLLPLLAGAATRWLFPALAARIILPLEALSSIVLAVVYAIVLLSTYRLIFMLDIRSYVAMALMVAGALVSGHLAASGLPEEQTTLALESASRNSGLAMLIASEFASLENALPVLIPYALASAIICFIYVRYQKMERGAKSSAASD